MMQGDSSKVLMLMKTTRLKDLKMFNLLFIQATKLL